MKSNNKIILVVILVSLVIGVIGELCSYFAIRQFNNLTQAIHSIGRLAAIIVLLRDGTLIRKKFIFSCICISIAFITAGALMKIMHWPFAHLLLLCGLISVPVLYSVHFYKKQDKRSTDILKLLWVLFMYTSAVFVVEHFSFGRELRVIEGILFLVVYADFARNKKA